MKYQKLITAGCSYSACSSSIEESLRSPRSWPHFLSNFLMCTQLVNLGIPGSGTQSMVYNLINFCDSDIIDASQTLIVFNITELHRWDIMCPVGHPDACKHFSWDKILNHSWILSEHFNGSSGKHYMQQLGINMGVEQQIKTNCLSIISLVNYLKQRGLNYYFIMLDDNFNDTNTPDFFKRFLQSEIENAVMVENHYSMLKFATESQKIADDQCHPNTEGYKTIAEHIFKKIILDSKQLHRATDR